MDFTRLGPFCRHRWIEVGRDTHAPVEYFEFGGGLWSSRMDDIFYGYTIISLRCDHCGSVRTDKVQGSFRDERESAPEDAATVAVAVGAVGRESRSEVERRAVR
jgi:hypothetical protein